MPVVSVVLPTRRRPHLVSRALASVLSQTWRDLEVLLVDDNDAGERLRGQHGLEAALSDPRIVLIENPEPHNASRARNAGLRAALGEWITYLDDDDEYAPDKIARQLALARETGGILVTCGYEVRLCGRRRRRQVKARGFSGDALLTEAIWGTPFLFHRHDPAALFDEALAAGEDRAFALGYVRSHGLRRVPNVPAPLVVVRLQPDRVNLDREAHWQAARRILRDDRASFSHQARRLFLWRARLARAKFAEESLRNFLRAAAGLLRAGGWRETRTVVNATLHRNRLFRRWLVA